MAVWFDLQLVTESLSLRSARSTVGALQLRLGGTYLEGRA